MLPYPNIDPVIIRIGPLALRWYGLMYVLGFTGGYLLVKKQIQEEKGNAADQELRHLEGLMLSLIIGVVLGGRLGYVLFYNLPYYMDHPAEILATWLGGMSFHGGVIGACAAGWIYTHRHHLNFWHWADRFIVTAPIGLGLGRMGNFINGELFGRPTDVPWAMIFPQGGPVPRHPSQLYEALLEGVLLFCILWPLRGRSWSPGQKLALFLIMYSCFRFIAEFFRQPDLQLGFLAWGWVTMGQILSMALFMAGLILWWIRGAKQH